MNETRPDELADVRRLGRLEAERLDLSLREAEGREREERLTRLAWGVEAPWTPEAELPGEGSATFARQRQELEHLRAFHHAVLSSRPWRVIQALRRVVGRAW